MREPPAATPGPTSPEPAAEPSGRAVAPKSDIAPADAAARMEQVIDRFISGDGGSEAPRSTSPFPPALPVHAGGSPATDIVARLAPRPLDTPDRLPRIVTSSLPIRPPAMPDDDGGPPTPAGRPPFPLNAIAASARTRRDRLEMEGMRERVGAVAEHPSWTSWRTARRVAATAAVMTCIFSTGVIWAKHRSEMVAEISAPPAEIAVAMPEPAAVGGAGVGQPIRNTPVLIREGASADVPDPAEADPVQTLQPPASSSAAVTMPAPFVARAVNDREAALPAPMTPIAPVVRVVPVVPIMPSRRAAERMASVAPRPSMVDAVVTPAPPLDRRGLNELAARPAAETPDPHGPASTAAKRPKSSLDRRPKQREHATRTRPPVRAADAPASSRGAAPKVARGHVPPDGWEMRRQGLRTEPEPEPSMFKKLIGYVWPPGKAWNAAQPAKPAAPTTPAVTSKPFYWSDNGRARP